MADTNTNTNDSEIKASRLKARAGFGTNGDPTPSSVPAGTKTKLIEPSVAPPDAGAAAGDWQTRPVSSKQAVPTHDGFASAPSHSIPQSSSAAKPVKAVVAKAVTNKTTAVLFPRKAKRSGHHLKRKMK